MGVRPEGAQQVLSINASLFDPSPPPYTHTTPTPLLLLLVGDRALLQALGARHSALTGGAIVLLLDVGIPRADHRGRVVQRHRVAKGGERGGVGGGDLGEPARARACSENERPFFVSPPPPPPNL